MGEVYRAEDLRLGRKVALKVLSSQLALSEDSRARFEREARAVAALNHPHIVTIHSVEQENDVQFITMELVEGPSLSQLIPENGMDIDGLLDLALPLTEAVAAAHHAGIVHRDLKPENVMMSGDGRLKVLDFGLAKLRDGDPGEELTKPLGEELTKDGKVLGTASYMSPEQAEGATIGPASDVFTLGVMLYQMATGKRPFSGKSDISTILAIVRDKYPPVQELNPTISEDLVRIIDRCLLKNPSKRYPTAAALRQALAVLRSGEVEMPWATTERMSWMKVGLIGLAVAGVALGGYYALFLRPVTRQVTATAELTNPSIAVLPFRNLSKDPDNEYFSDGITAEITSKLARLDDLEVASQTSAQRYKGSALDIRDIGSELGVSFLLEGTVRRAGNRVRITAQLVDAGNGFQLWSEDFEGVLDDVFGVQETTALKIAEALDLRLSAGEQAGLLHRATGDPDAFDAYLRGRALLEYFSTPEKLEQAGSHFERALELDPDYPLALVGMSRVEAQYHRNLDPNPARLVRAESLARRALELDPSLAEAHLAMGQVLANHYRYEDAAERFRTALVIEPDNPYGWDLLSWSLAYSQPPDVIGAEEAARRSIELQPSLVGAHYHLGRALFLQGRHEEARLAFVASRELDPGFEAADFGLAQIFIAEGRYGEAIEALARLDKLLGSSVVPVQIAIARAGAGDLAGAWSAFERALELGYSDLAAVESAAELEPLRADAARYRSLLELYGVSEAETD